MCRFLVLFQSAKKGDATLSLVRMPCRCREIFVSEPLLAARLCGRFMHIDLSNLIGARTFLWAVTVGFVVAGWATEWLDLGIRSTLDNCMAWDKSIWPLVNSKYLSAMQVSTVVFLANALGGELRWGQKLAKLKPNTKPTIFCYAFLYSLNFGWFGIATRRTAALFWAMFIPHIMLIRAR
jgi:hypothetical protein